MPDVPRTTRVFLDALREHDAQAWSEFDRRYRPIVIAFGRRHGLREADAADVAQDTITRFLQEYRDGHYDPRRGRLRSWVMSMARTRIAAAHRERSRRHEATRAGEPVQAADTSPAELLDAERTAILVAALDLLRSDTHAHERTIAAFELFVLKQMPALAVAERLGISTHDVYQAKHRIAGRLRDLIAGIEHHRERG